jgi:SAM-dependent methyltransferase
VPTDWTETLDPTSAFFDAQRPRLEALPSGARALDIACGRGRHSVAAADLGLCVLSIDRNEEALLELARYRPARGGHIETRVVDLESEVPPVLDTDPFDVIFVFRYLHRPLMPWIADQLAPGGLLFYETFTLAQRSLGWGPSRDAFLLAPGELPGLFPTLEVEFFAEGLTEERRPAETARLVARRPHSVAR